MLAHFENGANCDGGKILATIHTLPTQFVNDRKVNRDQLSIISPRV